MPADSGRALAHHLGSALQLTNILRDLDEDASLGRLYLPREVLQTRGIMATDPGEVLAHPAIGTACADIVEFAGRHFAEADAIMARCPRRMVRAPRIMGRAYQVILDALVARGFTAPRAPIRLPRLKLLGIVLRNLF
jgi:phytoene synthase